MRLSNCLFVQNNMANNTQTNKFAKNIPYFAGEQSQCATTPPGLTRAYAGVKPLSFKGVTLGELKSFLGRKQPENSPYYKNIEKVILDEREALCVWMHSQPNFPGANRLIPKKNLRDANLYDGTLKVAKKAIIEARNNSDENFIANLNLVELNMANSLKEALGLRAKRMKSKKVSAPAQASELVQPQPTFQDLLPPPQFFDSAPAQVSGLVQSQPTFQDLLPPPQLAPAQASELIQQPLSPPPHLFDEVTPAQAASSRLQQKKEIREKLLGDLNQKTPLTEEQREFFITFKKACDERLRVICNENSTETIEKEKSNLCFFLEVIPLKLKGISLDPMQYANGHFSYIESNKRPRIN